MFEQAIVAEGVGARRPFSVGVSLVAQAGVLLGLILYPLIWFEVMPLVKPAPLPLRLRSVRLEPRPVVGAAVPSRRRPLLEFPVPSMAPRTAVAAVFDDGAPQVEGLSDGAALPAAISNLFSRALDLDPAPSAPKSKPEPAPVAKPALERGPVRVGGDVRPPQLLRQVKPAYPALARNVRVQGTVQIQALLARDGSVQSAKVVQGHPLLAAAALDAVRQWRYAPTQLNGEAVEVILLVDVNFTLSQ